ncbi:HlyD family efflux transporter periplasmic adaptor subunit [Paractinoplanes rhizophilus]|jgi:HlyD family secretion protein|uniref:HlyD family efflux transporter periplasmic adaptor subunit n=1 Tax=Paractinoplanes rhizophilus TaxID=1416877 RepID=A0ABW2HHE0_9ACTN|nr:HlyD family efflux transporter periplasmic adaptor subunit [Actinoplanes sp.]
MGEALAGRRRWIGVAAAVVAPALIAYGVTHALRADATEKPATIATVAVDRGAVTTQVATTGTVQPAQTRSLSFAVKGTVRSISVRAGTTVGPGQVLAKVDDTAAAEAVSDARDSLNDAEDALAEARENAARTSSTTDACGANVAAAYASSTPTATPPPTVTGSPSATASAGATPSRTAAPAASVTRIAPATPTGAGSTGRTPDGTTGAGSCGTGRAAGQPEGGQSGDAILTAQQRVTRATRTLADAEDALAGTTITAPIAGRILGVGGQVGGQVGAGSTFITLADVYDMQISAAFPEADADRLAAGQAGAVTLADRPGTEFEATVAQVDPTGTSDGTMVRYGVLLSFVDAPPGLLVGQSAGVKVTTGSKPDVLRVPSTAVHDLHDGTGTVLKDGARAPVGVGLRGDQYTEITSGVAAGDRVARSW